jgi:hypothetical protein
MLTIDFSAFERKAREFDAAIDQVPYALSLAMNEAVKNTRELLIRDTWPRHIEQRNANFIRAALKITQYASKRNLRVVIGENPQVGGRGSIALHAKGGTRTAKAGRIAVPSQDLKARRGAHGVPKGMRPTNAPNTFKKGDILYQRTGRKGRNLKLLYTLKPSARIPAQVPFEDDFKIAMVNEMRTSFPAALAKAMRGRRV